MQTYLTSARPFISQFKAPLSGEVSVAGDKSISHRALMLGSQIIGKATIHGLLEGDDVIGTLKALRQLGVTITHADDGSWVVHGRGVGGLCEAPTVLDMGNSGTGVRLLAGLVSSYPFTTFFTGDESLCARPMKRVTEPLAQTGAQITSRSGGRLPLCISGSAHQMPIKYELPVASAQVKSAIMLSALNIAGTTTIIEPVATRDHTERMLRYLGFAVTTESVDGKTQIQLQGQQTQTKQDVVLNIPGDPSSAAFPIVAALIVPGSEVTIRNVCINPLRIGLFTVLKQMGADITILNEREQCGEPVGDIRVRHSALTGITIPASVAPSMIDEYPILAIAAAYATGTTIMQGLEELRVKESDRLSAILNGLIACGVRAEASGDSLTVQGGEGTVIGGGTVVTHFDHRIAMAFLIMGLASTKPVMIDDGNAISTSFPNFHTLMTNLGAFIARERRSFRRIYRDQPLVIAIDGPAASGKGTLARRLAEHFGLPYLDTGSLYRVVGMKLMYNQQDPNDKAAAIAAAQSVEIQDLSNPRLRQEHVGKAASVVSAMPEVRAILLNYQREVAADRRGAILDGRDIGTVVCPNADLKLFMTASIDARAARRHRELQGQGIEVVYESVLNDLVERDARDSQRKNAPLVAADDAVLLDTTQLSADDVFRQVLALVEERMADNKAA